MKLAFLVFSILFLNCGHAQNCINSLKLRSYKPKYARHFSIDYYENYKVVHVDNDKYLLSNNVNNCRDQYQANILTPVKKAAFMSTTYLPALEILQKAESLIAFQGRQYIVSSYFDKNKIKELPYKMNPEELLALKADLVMGYSSNLTDTKQKQILKKLQIPVVINKDFEEINPLARAEWIVFISSFYNSEDHAIKIFDEIEKDYLSLKKHNESLPKSSVIVGSIENGFWITCGGQSDFAQLLKDAAGELAFSRNNKETQKISLEELFSKNKLYKVWLTHNSWKSEVDRKISTSKDSRYKHINAKNVYNNNLISNENGATDFWEMAVQRPDWLLRDLSAVLHPEKFPGYKLKWYRKI
jgi:iron complex transport system substrate-binding protein